MFIQYHFPLKADNHPFFKNQLNKIIPHRGGLGIFPENTLYAFDQAKELGFNILELDVRSTLDSVLVVFHDSTLTRMTGNTGQISQLLFNQLQSFTIYSEKHGSHKIPTVEELFNRIHGVHFIIEIKSRENYISNLLCNLINNYQLTNNVLIASFTSDQTEKFREECPSVATGATIDEMKLFGLLNKFYLDGVIIPEYEAMILPLNWKLNRLVTQELTNRVNEKNLNLFVWTVNDTNIISELLDFGVTGIISDLYSINN